MTTRLYLGDPAMPLMGPDAQEVTRVVVTLVAATDATWSRYIEDLMRLA
jgi:hypothetical protein